MGGFGAWGLPGLLATAMAMDDISSTKHNFSTTGTGDLHLVAAPDGDSQKDQLCVFCHTPHQGDTTQGVVLWNRRINESGYTMYDSATMDMTVAAQPQSVSLACLSCHDGTIAFDALRNGPGSGDYNANAPARGWNFKDNANKMPSSSAAYVALDLANDHPVSVTFDDGADNAFYDKDSVLAAGLKFYDAPSRSSGDQVECASCHNPHSADIQPFLRKSNARSELCLTCHIK